jgi:uncharacterized protein
VSAELSVRALYDHVAAGDFNSVTQMLDDDVVFVQADSLPFGGEWRGTSGFAEMAARITAAWPGFAAAPRTFFSNGDAQVAVLTRLSGDGIDMDMMELWTVVANRITRCQPFYFDTAAAVQSAKEYRS